MTDFSDPPFYDERNGWTGMHSVADIHREILRICPTQPCACSRCVKLLAQLPEAERRERTVQQIAAARAAVLKLRKYMEGRGWTGEMRDIVDELERALGGVIE